MNNTADDMAASDIRTLAGPSGEAVAGGATSLIRESWTIDTLKIFNTYYMAVAIYAGLLGNLLSFLTFTSTHLRARTSSYYMSALAASDFGYLFVLSFNWLAAHGFNIYLNPGACEIAFFLSGVFASLSVWLTVGFTAERYLAVCYPLWRLHLSTKRRAKVVVAVLVILSIIANLHALFTVTLKPDGDSYECSADDSYEQVVYYANIVDTLTTFVLPVLLISMMNLMIARSTFLFYARCRQQRPTLYVRTSNGPTPEPLKVLNTLNGGPVMLQQQQQQQQQHFCKMEIGITQHNGNTAPSLVNNRTSGRTLGVSSASLGISGMAVPSAIQITVTRMLLLVSTVFVILNLPFYLSRIYLHSYQNSIPDNSYLYVLQRYFMLLYYTNFSINFVLYNVSSRMFRIAMCDYLYSRWLWVKASLVAWRPSSFCSSSSVQLEQEGQFLNHHVVTLHRHASGGHHALRRDHQLLHASETCSGRRQLEMNI
ncbi:pyrokinin-1 receptor-like isoform X1 [Varroa destructor]|uniref:G-protein coupled receptors family 1 profile domain-containing protein n=1 Tax=Varroa destructor TaxID=109461 RepID=A0A7M7JP52_VARDE|nr:pyrokinin-1 receptor-like isoform X1 [Varroa destructor]